MQKLKLLLIMAAMSTMFSCAYSGVAATSDGHAIIARNDGLLFGALRKVFVCRVSAGGLASCAAGEAP